MSTGLQSLLENTAGLSRELSFEAGVDGALRAVNPAWDAVLGWSEAELEAMRLHDLVHPDDMERATEALSRAVESEGAFGVDARCRARDGSYRWVSWRVRARGDVLQGAGHDISALNAAHAALRQLQEGDSTTRDRKAVHDINNLMQNIVGALELVRKLIGSGRLAETERFITSAIGAAHRAAELNQQHGAPRAAPEGKTFGGSVEP